MSRKFEIIKPGLKKLAAYILRHLDVDMGSVETSGKRNLNNKSSSNLIETGFGAVIEVKTSVPVSKALEYTLRIRSGNIK